MPSQTYIPVNRIRHQTNAMVSHRRSSGPSRVHHSDEVADAGDGPVTIEASDLAFAPERVSAAAGEIEVVIENVGAVEHDFVIEEAGDEVVVLAAPGETASGSIELEAGSYTFYCSIPGHRDAGMEGTLEVQ
jgi:uncharacterized cupredoxin-like copper-binding protein